MKVFSLSQSTRWLTLHYHANKPPFLPHRSNSVQFGFCLSVYPPIHPFIRGADFVSGTEPSTGDTHEMPVSA